MTGLGLNKNKIFSLQNLLRKRDKKLKLFLLQLNNGYHGTGTQPPTLNNGTGNGKIPPAVPPRSRDSSVTMTRAQYQTITSLTNGLATIKRNSLGHCCHHRSTFRFYG